MAQLHFATSILPARLHSHSVDPFTEGMSHMPPSDSLFLPFTSPDPTPTKPLRHSVSSLSNLSSVPFHQARQLLLALSSSSFSSSSRLLCFLSQVSRSHLVSLSHSGNFSLSLFPVCCDRWAVAPSRGGGGCTFCRISESRALLICRT